MRLTRNLTGRFAAKAAAAIVVGAGIFAAAGTASAGTHIPAISVGSGNHDGVRCVQTAVDNWARRTGHGHPLTVDGQFGSQTRTWVEKFQAAYHLHVDGIVGPHTGDKIVANQGSDWTCPYNVPTTWDPGE